MRRPDVTRKGKEKRRNDGSGKEKEWNGGAVRSIELEMSSPDTKWK